MIDYLPPNSEDTGGFSGRELAQELTDTSFIWPNYFDEDGAKSEAFNQRAEKLGLRPEYLGWQEQTAHDVLLVAKALGAGELAKASARAWITQIKRMAQLQMEVDKHPVDGLTAREVERARRDVSVLFLVASVALGAQDHQAGIENGVDVRFVALNNRGRAGYEAIYNFCVDSFCPLDNDEYQWRESESGGGYEGPDGRVYRDEVHYPGQLRIELKPETGLRIGLTYEFDLSSGYYQQNVEHLSRTGRPRSMPVADCNVRIDADSHAPAGVAADMGRSKFKSDNYTRPGDLLGKVMEQTNPESGSHLYGGFSSDMKAQLAPLVEQIVVHQKLIEARVKDTGDSRMPVTADEMENNVARYREAEAIQTAIESGDYELPDSTQ